MQIETGKNILEIVKQLKNFLDLLAQTMSNCLNFDSFSLLGMNVKDNKCSIEST